MKKKICITGATGIMGTAVLREFKDKLDRFELRILARPGKKNEKLLKEYSGDPSVKIIYGNLLNYEDVREAVGDSDMVLHIGGMVSPVADHYPALTMKVNITASENIVRAIKSRADGDNVALIYIGSVAETSHHDVPGHWGRTGDPVMTGIYDYYGISKILAERVIAESGLKRWVSLRQSGILHAGLLKKGMDPITFHVPLRGVLEWTTLEDSGRLLVNLCDKELPDSFWKGFYNIGSGKEYRLANYQFEKLLLKALGCPPPEKIFEPGWFATRNFHGMWYSDSDLLESIVPFRENLPAEKYFERMGSQLPGYFKLARFVPSFIMKAVMRRVANSKGNGTMYWLKNSEYEEEIRAYFGSREAQRLIGGWDNFDFTDPSRTPTLLDHGYDENKPESELDLEDMKGAARFRGGKCLCDKMTKGDLDTPLEWECAFGHRFKARPRTILKGGHWCPECMPAPWRYDEEARVNQFLAQVWRLGHNPEENEVYDSDSQIGNRLK